MISLRWSYNLVVAKQDYSLVVASWQRTLDGIPTLSGRLAYLASLRDPNTDEYQHFGLAQRLGAEASGQLLRECHGQVFLQWLGLDYPAQRADLTGYLQSLDGNPKEIFTNWLRLEPWLRWLPAESRETERILFLSDLSAVSAVIRAEFGVACPDPDL